MRVLVIGANGQVARQTLIKLTEAGHTPIAMIRNPDQADELKALG